jgi:hypothetical protein
MAAKYELNGEKLLKITANITAASMLSGYLVSKYVKTKSVMSRALANGVGTSLGVIALAQLFRYADKADWGIDCATVYNPAVTPTA